VDKLTAAVPVPHTVIHVIPRRVGDQATLPECGDRVEDDGVLS
jgi:diadenosine tetraphosphate (Ap4A) HIT family hydrolase